jgi:L-serine/L-threonine ammonia-lyase
MPLHIQTPLIASLPMSQRLGRPIWLKMEALQPPGSFKLRGVGLACEHHAARGARRLLSSSGGNAGLAVAWAGRQLGLAVQVVVPQTTSAVALHNLRLEGASVLVHGVSWQEAHAYALSLQTEGDAFIHPFDDPLLWQGHATLMTEVAATGLRPAAVVLSVGGGGLLCGVVQGLQTLGWHDVPVLAVETAGAASLNAALLAQERVVLERITSLATSLGARQVCEQAFAVAQEHPVHSLVVSDAQAVDACVDFLNDHRIVVEPACGAALAGAACTALDLPPKAPVLVVVCGGATSTAAQLLAQQAQLHSQTHG